MKYSRFLLLSAVTISLLFTGCGTKDETVTPVPVESESVESESVELSEPEPETAENDTESLPEMIDSETTCFNNYPSLDVKNNIIMNEDGTYSYSEEWLGEFSMIFDGWYADVKIEDIQKVLEIALGEVSESTTGAEIYEGLSIFKMIIGTETCGKFTNKDKNNTQNKQENTQQSSQETKPSNNENKQPQQSEPSYGDPDYWVGDGTFEFDEYVPGEKIEVPGLVIH